MSLEDIVAHIADPEERAEALARLRHEVGRRQRRAQPAPPRIVRTEKRCPRCEQVRPIEDFGISRTRADGRQSTCRSCR